MKVQEDIRAPQDDTDSAVKDDITNDNAGSSPKFLQLMGTDTVDLTVGPEEKLFCVHRKLLCDKVPYFAKMFGTGFKEAEEGTAHFPEDKVESFGLLMEWIYFNTLEELTYLPNTFTWKWCPIAFYGLAEKLLLTELKDKIMDLIYDHQAKQGHLFGLGSIKNAYANTMDGSPLRRYASHCFLYALLGFQDDRQRWSTEHLQRAIKEHEDLAKDVFTLMRGTNGVAARLPTDQFQKCDFHHHGIDKACPYRP